MIVVGFFFNIIKIDNDKINQSDPVVHLCTIFTTSKLMKIHCSKILKISLNCSVCQIRDIYLAVII